MKKTYITALSEFTESFVAERCAEVQLEIEQNPERFPRYAQRIANYQDMHNHLVQKHPESRMEIDELNGALTLAHVAAASEIYKQGTADGAALLLFFLTTGNRPREDVK